MEIGQSNQQTLAKVIGGTGIATFIIGGVIFIVLMMQFSEPSLLSRGGLTLTEFFIAVMVTFYHLVLGLLCLGVAQALSPTSSSTRTTEAEQLQREMNMPESQGEWKCRQCGENNPQNFDFCWKCGASAKPTEGEN